MGGALKLLQLGQSVRLQALESSYQVIVLAAGEPGAQVIEVGADYVVVDNAEEGVQTRIPMHLIKAVMTSAEAAVPVPEPEPAPLSPVATAA